eukprot:CAMPEP_0206574774 /NCGR_PEP_ID=MMETSP0325_2-20121206/29663_1 /ASSEMBLY_ACC=CAM_ASM_000347 /TAXON_ID=2866 /ORGANISM="Crypthecodinium cohnii, Strain Seligo" /LENGTH=624 /DNA_ID=CAMNT_0054079477 /DNA_START=365 /DNA_END=2236 /DNA_ORIENTATION=-
MEELTWSGTIERCGSRDSQNNWVSDSKQICRCGNRFKADANFCRMCGRPRPVENLAQTGRMVGRLSPVGSVLFSINTHDFGDSSGSFEHKPSLVQRARNIICGCRCRRPGYESDSVSQTSEEESTSEERARARPRILDREGHFGQSMGKWNVRRWASKDMHHGVQRLYLKSIFHSFLDLSLWRQLLVYSTVYVVMFMVFAPMFWWMNDACGLNLRSFGEAYFLSLETFVTIGYGVPDQYFNDCWEGTIGLTFLAMCQYFCNAFVIGALFVRLTRPQARANTILFSSKAVIQELDGALYFMFQALELKHHELVEAQFRLYCIRYDEGGFRSYPMRLQQPDDDLGAYALLTLPTRVVHRIDNWSPLSPTSEMEPNSSFLRPKKTNGQDWSMDALEGLFAANNIPDPNENKDRYEKVDTALPRSFHAPRWNEVPQRQVDAEQGNKATCVCPVCGDSFQNLQLLRRHTEYNAVQDIANGIPEAQRHGVWLEEELRSQGWELVEGPQAKSPETAARGSQMKRYLTPLEGAVGPCIAPIQPTRANVEAFVTSRHVEVVALLEGVEPTSSSTLQARHSYLFPEDVEWDMAFEDCLDIGTETKPPAIDEADSTPSSMSTQPGRGGIGDPPPR